MTTANNWP